MNTVRRRRGLTAAAIGMASALTLSGCFGGDTGEAGSEGSDDERLSVIMFYEPSAGLDPYSDDVTNLSRWGTAETLFVLDLDGLPEPRLAESYEQIDENTWNVTIRSDVTFHDGTEMTVDSVVQTFTNALESATPPIALTGVSMDVEAIDDTTVQFVTETPDPVLPLRITSPSLSIFAESAFGEDGTVSPVGTGTGPFELTNVGGVSSATLERYDDYWGGAAQLAGLDVSFVSDGASRTAALRTGDADIIENVPVSQVSLLDEELVHEIALPRTISASLNTESGVFSDPAMRAAAREAIDQDEIVERVFEGNANAGEGIFGPATPWAAELRGDVTPDVAAADPDGAEITLATYSDRAELPEIAVLLEQQLETAGFSVQQDVREYSNFEADALEGNFDIVIGSRATQLETGDPVSFLLSDYSCDGAGFNFTQLCDPAVDELILAANVIEPGVERQQAVVDAEAAILLQDALVPLAHETIVQGEGTHVQGAVRDPNGRLLVDNETTVSH